MTREEILGMEAGPELDRLVAEQIMGWEEGRNFSMWPEQGVHISVGDGIGFFWRPSTDITAAWEVMTKLCELGMVPEVYGMWLTKKKNEWYIVLWYSVEDLTAAARAKASTLPLAICRAALLAMMRASDE